MDTEEQFYISWRGKVTGPFSLEQIETRLVQRKINSLSRIQIGGEWVLLRDALAQLRQIKPEPEPEPVVMPIPVRELEPVQLTMDAPEKEVRERAPAQAPEPKTSCLECGTQTLMSSARARSGLCAPCSSGNGNSQSSSEMDGSDWFWGIFGLGIFIFIMWVWISAGSPSIAPDKWFLVPGKRGIQPVPVYEFDTK